LPAKTDAGDPEKAADNVQMLKTARTAAFRKHKFGRERPPLGAVPKGCLFNYLGPSSTKAVMAFTPQLE
jgi:hypothetical protein